MSYRFLPAVLALALVATLSGCAVDGSPSGPTTASSSTVRVPADAATIQQAVDEVPEGGLVLVSPGTYTEEVTVATKNITLRGLDRDGVIIDGEGLRANGIQVIADGVRVQNLTVTRHTFNGVLVTGMHDENGPQAHNLTGYQKLDPEKFPPLQRFEVDHVTASNNGLYGIYAFNSQNGVLSNNYASGSADSGFYVGQCQNCAILVSGNVAERNAIGYENANASDSVVVTGNRFSGNRVGLTLLSWYQEAFVPQRGATVVGNVISDNNSADSPAQAQGGFGIGVGLSGAQSDTLERNIIAGNSVSGVQLSNTEDIATTGTRLTDNALSGNGVDVADVAAPRSPTSTTCITPDTGLGLLPADLAASCSAGASAGVPTSALPQVQAPAGVSFLKVGRPVPQPNLDGDLTAVPDALPKSGPAGSFDTSGVALPAAELLAGSAGTR
ncbi:right-handed parallel beta-helix repeat-containing protein [Agreia sp. Leaf210]|uniref:right-handed parallel beta-helix repeat-containing protein n=1 Tax=Agreia sp. Leaf210 TaxID=1735682 RepID=UPI0009E668E1|nr:right-handed parallel beta-helix repeat-containing protein [Agreia sp. Leaf210]